MKKRGSQYIPSKDIEEPYEEVKEPRIGKSYHLIWAYRGARFILKRIIDSTYCEVYTGKTNKKLIKAKISDLRHCRGETG